MELLNLDINGPIAHLTLNDPQRRNALSLAMFDELDTRIGELQASDEVIAVVLRGQPPAFCAGFDLAAAVDDPAVMATFIERLSSVCQQLRRLPAVVIAAVDGAALAGGCALLSACDIVITSPGAKLGYPVHQIGVSPAVTIPTLQQKLTPGQTRALLMSGEIINGEQAASIGLATTCTIGDTTAAQHAEELARTIANHGKHALRTTKQWLNELDGSCDTSAFENVARGSAAIVNDDEAVTLLRQFWQARQQNG